VSNYDKIWPQPGDIRKNTCGNRPLTEPEADCMNISDFTSRMFDVRRDPCKTRSHKPSSMLD